MDAAGRPRAGAERAPCLDEAFWAIVDANWSAEDLSFLVLLWKRFEDALARRRP